MMVVFFFLLFCVCMSGMSLWVINGNVINIVVSIMLGIVKMILKL